MGSTVFLILKVFEVALSLIVMGLTFEGSEDYKIDVTLLTVGTYAGYTMIIWFLIIAFLMNESFDKKIEVMALALGCILFIFSAGILLDMYNVNVHNSLTRCGLAAGIISVILAVIFAVDSILNALY